MNQKESVSDPGHPALAVDIHSQPDPTTCGPTCLDAVYRYFGDDISLDTVIAETGKLEQGGTLAVFLGSHALTRGYRATIYTYNLTVFDPSWFTTPETDLRERLMQQKLQKHSPKLRVATDAYTEFLGLGGRIRLRELTPALIRGYLKRSVPILAGLSATYLYRTPRELSETDAYDDIRGEPMGHFVVLCGYDTKTRQVSIADPLHPNPMSDEQYYYVDMYRLVGAVYLGVLTFDANLLVIEPRSKPKA